MLALRLSQAQPTPAGRRLGDAPGETSGGVLLSGQRSYPVVAETGSAAGASATASAAAGGSITSPIHPSRLPSDSGDEFVGPAWRSGEAAPEDRPGRVRHRPRVAHPRAR